MALIVPTTNDGPAQNDPPPDLAPAPPPAPPQPSPPPVAAEPAPSEPTPAAPPPNKYAAIVDQLEGARQVRLRASLRAASAIDPDAHAKALALSAQTGVPADVAARNPAMVGQVARQQGVDYQGLLKDHPELSAWLSDPNHAAIAQDDIPVLRTLDHAVHAITNPNEDQSGLLPDGYRFGKNGTILGPAYGGYADQYDGIDALQEHLRKQGDLAAIDQMDRAAAAKRLDDSLGPLSSFVGGGVIPVWAERLAALQRLAGQNNSDALKGPQEYAQASADLSPGLGGRLLRGAGGFVDPALLVGGPAAKGLLSLARIGQVARILEPIAAKLGPTWVARAGSAAETAATFAPQGAAGAVTDQEEHGTAHAAMDFLINTAVPGAFAGAFGTHGVAKALLGKLSPGAESWAAVAAGVAKEAGFGGGQLGTITIANAMHAVASGTDPNALDSDRLIPALVDAGLLGGLTAGAANLPGEIGARFHAEVASSSAAKSFADRLAFGVEALKASATAKRSPDEIPGLLQTMTGKDADTQVYAQTGEWDQHWTKAGVDPAAAAEQAGVGQAYREAKATGGEMAVPLHAFLQGAASLEKPGELLRIAREAPGAKSAGEADAFFKTLPEHVDQLTSEAKTAATAAEGAAPDESYQSVHDDLLHQLVEAGYDRGAAKKQAEIDAAGFRTLAARWNAGLPEGSPKVDAFTLYQRYGLKVLRAAPESVRGGTDRLGAMVDQLKKGTQPKQTDLFGPSLHDFLREKGVSDPGGDLASMEIPTPPFQKKLLREGGRPLDLAAIEAHREGYIPDALPNTLLDAIKQESLGKPVYAGDKANPELLSRHQEALEFRSFVESLGIDPKKASREEILAKLADYQKSHEPAMAAQHQRTLAQSDSGSGVLDVKTAPAGSLNAAAEHFGTTKDIAEAGYILPDGRMLNFSGGARGKRTIDHLDVAEVRGVPGSGFEAMAAFLRAGAMRIDAKEGAVTLETKPTLSQESVIKAIAERRGGELAFDLVDGSRRTGRYYDEGTKPARILGDVRRFYAGEDFGNGKVLFQSEALRQGAENAIRRGQIAFGKDRQFSVTLFENANLSTFLHESGHLFLEVLGDLAHEESAPAQIKGDYAKILEWFGAKDREAISTEHHEQFARGFERYLMEGVAPSGALRQTFARVRAWFVHLYKSLAGLNVNLSDEVRGVFDRLLATDEEIASAEHRSEAEPLFADAKTAGMTPEQFAAYGKAMQTAHDEATTALQTQVMHAAQQEQSKLYRDERRKIRGEMDAMVGQRPVYAAIEALQDGVLPEGVTLPEGAGRITLSKADLLAHGYTQADLATLPGRGKGKANRGRHVYSEEGGIPLDAAAELFGFRSGAELFDAMAKAGDRKAVVAQETDARMRELYPDPLTDGTIHERADEAVHGELRSKVIDQELQALQRLARDAAPVVKQQVAEAIAQERSTVAGKEARAASDQRLKDQVGKAIDALGASVEGEAARQEKQRQAANDRAQRAAVLADLPPMQLVRVAAETAIGSKRVRDVRPEVYRIAAQKAARRALERMGAKKYADAFEAKRQEQLNVELYRAAQEAVKAGEKARKYLAKFDQGDVRERIGKAGGWEWSVKMADGTFASFPSDAEAVKHAQASPGSEYLGRTSGYLEQIDHLLERFELRRVSVKQLERRETLAEFIATHNDAGQLAPFPDHILNEAFSANYRSLTVDELAGLRDSVRAIERQASKQNELLKNERHKNLGEAIAEAEATIDANTNGPRKRKLGVGLGDPQRRSIGTFFGSHDKLSYILHEMDGFKDGGPLWEMFMRPANDAANTEVEKLSASNARVIELFKEWGKDGYLATVHKKVPGITDTLSLEGRICVALNWGNLGNRARLKRGFQWEDEHVQAVLETLDVKDKALVEGLWKHIDTFWPEVRAKEERVFGVAPEKVEAVPFQTSLGDWSGGYYPAKYDGELSPTASNHADADLATAIKRAAYVAQTTRRGHTEAREGEGSGAGLRLDFGVVREHVIQVVHDLTHHEMLIDTMRLLRGLQDKIQSHYGADTLRQIRGTFEDIALGQAGASKRNEKFWNWLRSGVTTSALAFKAVTATINLTGFVQSLARVSPKYLARGLFRMMRSPTGFWEAHQWCSEVSSLMRNRGLTQTREFVDFRAAGTVRSKFDKAAYAFMELTQRLVDVPTFAGAYEQAMEGAAGGDHAKAVAIAEQAVTDTQGSGLIKDLSAIQRGSPAQKLWTTLYSYSNVTFNTLREAGKIARVHPAQALGYLVVFAAQPILGRMLRDAIVGSNQQDYKDPKAVALALAREEASFLMGTVVGGRELSSAFSSEFGYTGPAGARGIESSYALIQALTHGHIHNQTTGAISAPVKRAAVDLVGILFHLPSSQALKSYEGIVYWSQHRDANPLPILVGPPPKAK